MHIVNTQKDFNASRSRITEFLGRSPSDIGKTRIVLFQAEDGIRDKLVTGVQTCALPILKYLSYRNLGEKGGPEFSEAETKAIARSEERRVGKECRSRLSPHP